MALETTTTEIAERVRRRPPPRGAGLPRRSAVLSRLFLAYVRRYLGRHFHAVRVSRAGPLPNVQSGPLLVVANHPSWWDPLIGFLLADRIGRALYAPIDAVALERYSLFRRLGMFGVELGSVAGSRAFLSTGQAVLESPGSVLLVTPQGRFADVRERPVRVMPGVGHLARRVGHGTIVPVALEYPFWNERLPEALVHCGPPISIEADSSPAAWSERVAAELATAQDSLAELTIRRNPAAFETVLSGRVGVGAVYDGWRRIKAALGGRWFDPRHRAEGPS